MAGKPKPKPYEPGVIYDVRLTRLVRQPGMRLLPRDQHEIEGAALNAIVAAEGEDVIGAADPRK